jgi:glycosyltransferase involved in cell wall biosynthesis
VTVGSLRSTPSPTAASAGDSPIPAGPAPARVGYLLSKYPSANHTYLVREVRALRAAGLDVVTAAVDGDDRPADAVSPEDREERATTFVVKRAGVAGVLGAHLATALTRPLAYLSGLALAVRLARTDLGRLAYNLFYFAEAVVAGRHLHRRGCAQLHTHYATNVALLAARVFPFDLSASIHGSAEFIDPQAQRLREKVAACAFVRAISLYGRSQMMLAAPTSDWDKVRVIRLGVDLGEFEPAEFRESPRPFRLATVGQLQPAKGFPVLLDAVAALAREGRPVEVTLVGDGAGRAELEARAARLGVAPHVRFTGALTQAGVRAVLRDADAFVLPSFAEGIPVVLMEAMAMRVPCVASRITGIPELVEHGREGLLVTPSDADALADALRALMDDSGARRRMGEAGRARVAREYDLARNVAQLALVFAERAAGARVR